MRKRWTGEMVREFVEGEGYKLIEVSNFSWVKMTDRIWVSCGKHEPYDVSWGNFKKIGGVQSVVKDTDTLMMKFVKK